MPPPRVKSEQRRRHSRQSSLGRVFNPCKHEFCGNCIPNKSQNLSPSKREPCMRDYSRKYYVPMANAISALTMASQSDPDAQATVNDFLDFTEFFPSDLHRSLTLIGKLDQAYEDDSQKIHELTRTYGQLPQLSPAERPDPLKLRQDISTTLDHALRTRDAAYAEASRLSKSAGILCNRLATIREKLLNLPKPPSRDPTPVRQSRSPELQRKDRAPKITLFTDSNRPRSSGAHNQAPRPRRLIVPGEVLPPEELLSPGAGYTSDEESDFESRRSTSRHRDKTPGWGRPPKSLKLDRVRKTPKFPLIRPPGQFGTNVHSQVAGISVSNAMALLPRPPDNPVIGSIHAPWNDLTEWELNLIRKRMKKNAHWMPSEVMKRRELAAMGRGRENYERAKALAEQTGTPFVCEVDPHFDSPAGLPESTAGAILPTLTGDNFSLPRPYETKKQAQDRERAEREKREMEELGKQITDAGKDFGDSWSRIAAGLNGLTSPLSTPLPTPVAESKKELSKSTGGRRYRRGSSMNDRIDIEEPATAPKMLRLSTTRLTSAPLQTLDTADTSPAPDSALTSTSGKSPSINFAPTGSSVALVEDEVADLDRGRGTSESVDAQPSGRSTRATATRATSAAATNITTTTGTSARESSAGTSRLSLKLQPKQAEQAEPEKRRLSLRRTAPSLGNDLKTPTPATHESSKGPQTSAPPRRSSRRSSDGIPAAHTEPKPTRPLILLNQPQKKLTLKSNSNGTQSQQLDEEGPYCLPACKFGRISEGQMVACENKKCPSEWYHFDCVGLKEMPPRKQKWYCPPCQQRLGVTEGGEPVPKARKRKR